MFEWFLRFWFRPRKLPLKAWQCNPSKDTRLSPRIGQFSSFHREAELATKIVSNHGLTFWCQFDVGKKREENTHQIDQRNIIKHAGRDAQNPIAHSFVGANGRSHIEPNETNTSRQEIRQDGLYVCEATAHQNRIVAQLVGDLVAKNGYRPRYSLLVRYGERCTDGHSVGKIVNRVGQENYPRQRFDFAELVPWLLCCSLTIDFTIQRTI